MIQAIREIIGYIRDKAEWRRDFYAQLDWERRHREPAPPPWLNYRARKAGLAPKCDSDGSAKRQDAERLDGEATTARCPQGQSPRTSPRRVALQEGDARE